VERFTLLSHAVFQTLVSIVTSAVMGVIFFQLDFSFDGIQNRSVLQPSVTSYLLL